MTGKGERTLMLALRVVLGALFVYAGVAKLADVAGFAVDIANYRVLPPRLVAPLAAALPGVEIAAGVCLLAGRWTRAAALVAGGMLAVFSVAVAQALARGINLECGCFGASRDPVTTATLARDIVLLAMAAVVAWRADDQGTSQNQSTKGSDPG